MPRVDDLDFPDELFYDAGEHLWLRPAAVDGRALLTIGIDQGGQDALGDVVYVQLSQAGRGVVRGEPVGSVEAEKMVRPLLAPVTGTLREVNPAVVGTPRLVNSDPYGAGWLFRIEADDWASERARLLHGGDAVTAWIRAELAAHGRK